MRAGVTFLFLSRPGDAVGEAITKRMFDIGMAGMYSVTKLLLLN
jgi:hypothetical protein